MKVSVLTVTENRTEFMEWLAFVYNSQTYKDKELVVIDSSIPEERKVNEEILSLVVNPKELVYLPYPNTGCCIAEKRNVAMDAASGEYITWLDDDDWKAPHAIQQCMDELQVRDRAVITVRVKFPFINLYTMETRYIPTFMWSLGVYKLDLVQGIRFIEKGPRGAPNLCGEDTQWQGHVWQHVPQGRQTKLMEGTSWLGCALTHTKNIANRVGKAMMWKYPLPNPPPSVDSVIWDEVMVEINALKGRLGI